MEPTDFPFGERIGLRSAAPAGSRARTGWEAHPGVRSGTRLTRGERAADLARDMLGSWPYVGVVVVLTITAMATERRLAPVMAGLALVAVSLVLMATRRIDRAASEQALYALGMARRAEAVTEEILNEVDQVSIGLVRVAARIEALNVKCRTAGDPPASGHEPRS
jgi:uncharacterized membrane protein